MSLTAETGTVKRLPGHHLFVSTTTVRTTHSD